MFGSEAISAPGSESIAHIIQVALTPVFLLSGIASLLGVFAGRLARIADRVDALEEKLDSASPAIRATLERRLSYLRRRSHILDATVVLGALAGAATCAAALTLFVGTLRDHTVKGFLFAAFGLALLCTMGALGAFLAEMLLASRGLRDRTAGNQERAEAAEAPDSDADSASHDAGASPAAS